MKQNIAPPTRKATKDDALLGANKIKGINAASDVIFIQKLVIHFFDSSNRICMSSLSKSIGMLVPVI